MEGVRAQAARLLRGRRSERPGAALRHEAVLRRGLERDQHRAGTAAFSAREGSPAGCQPSRCRDDRARRARLLGLRTGYGALSLRAAGDGPPARRVYVQLHADPLRAAGDGPQDTRSVATSTSSRSTSKERSGTSSPPSTRRSSGRPWWWSSRSRHSRMAEPRRAGRRCSSRTGTCSPRSTGSIGSTFPLNAAI